MRKFSQRIGLVSEDEIIQKHSMNNDLRNSLWNVLYARFFDLRGLPDSQVEKLHMSFFFAYYFEFLKLPMDGIAQYAFIEVDRFKKYFFNCEWYEVYEVIEFVYVWSMNNSRYGEDLKLDFNFVLERESSAYRFVGDCLSDMISDEEISEIEEALDNEGEFSSVKNHLSRALVLMSDRKSPDFRNSGKESISAIESLVKIITKNSNGTLGQLIKEVERKKIIPSAMKDVYSKLYGYTSQEDGIRHALTDESKFGYPDAKYMLIVCSAFVNYVIEVYGNQALEEAGS